MTHSPKESCRYRWFGVQGHLPMLNVVMRMQVHEESRVEASFASDHRIRFGNFGQEVVVPNALRVEIYVEFPPLRPTD